MTTYWGKCSFGDSPLPPWELHLTESKGYVAIATRNFRAGELICIESPLTWCEGWHPFTSDQLSAIKDKVDELAPDTEEKAAFFGMSNVFPEVDPCAGIYMTNSFDMVGAENPSCGMYLAIARLNHSCTPNAQQTYIPESQEEVLYATRDITIGDEINDCYIELRQDTQHRRSELAEIYRFHCSCTSCSMNDSSSKEILNQSRRDDFLRVEARRLDTLVLSLAEEGEVDSALQAAQSLLDYLLSPQALAWSGRYLAEAYLNLYHISNTMYDILQEETEEDKKSSKITKTTRTNRSNYSPAYQRKQDEMAKLRKLSRAYLEKAHEWNVLLQGAGSGDSRTTLKYITDFASSER